MRFRKLSYPHYTQMDNVSIPNRELDAFPQLIAQLEAHYKAVSIPNRELDAFPRKWISFTPDGYPVSIPNRELDAFPRFSI